MENFRDALKPHGLIGVDTAPFIYQFEQHPRYHALTNAFFLGIEMGQWQAITSAITLMEFTVRPWQLNRLDIVRVYVDALTHFPNLTIHNVNRECAQVAARLRAHYRLHAADALQVATAMGNHATAFVTNDRQLKRLSPELTIIVLEDFCDG